MTGPAEPADAVESAGTVESAGAAEQPSNPASYLLGTELAAGIGPDAQLEMSAGGRWAAACVDVPASRWHDAVRLAQQQCGAEFFDWLGGVAADAIPPQTNAVNLQVVAHLWSLPRHCGLLLRTTLPHDALELSSVVDLFAGAAWYERETFEMFGITFLGHPNLRKLLLTDEFQGHPLRKEFVLASRVVKAWPGEKDPGDAGTDTPTSGRPARPRRRMLPPGVPEPGSWPPTDTSSTGV